MQRPIEAEPDYIEQVFGTRGFLAGRFSGYALRPGQVAMARHVDEAIRAERHLVVEGPCGTGKSIAYGVPATFHASRRGLRVLIVTANIALQEQLVRKDLPLLASLLPWPFTFALVKGRNNYLCTDRLAMRKFTRGFEKLEPYEQEQRDEVLKWARETQEGDVSELPFEPSRRVWRLVSVSSDECKGKDCGSALACFSEAARDRASAARIVVTNYHMLFAHLLVRAATTRNIVLPHFDVAILDEGHKAADIARDFFGFEITQGTIKRLSRELDDINCRRTSQGLDDAAGVFFTELRRHAQSRDYRARLKQKNVADSHGLVSLLKEARAHFSLEARKSKDMDARAGLHRNAERAHTVALQISETMQLLDVTKVYFVEIDEKQRATLCSKPIKVSDRLYAELFARTGTVIVTSATLSTSGNFEYVKEELGLNLCPQPPDSLISDTPFKIHEQARIIVPAGLPQPTDPAFPDGVADTFVRIIHTAHGRTLGLFTSYKNLNRAYERAKASGFRVLRQGDLPRSALIEAFRRDTQSVLMGTESFWNGVDVPGESLSCVVIDRLPFPTPDDPVLDAVQALDREAFINYSVPRAVIAFKQGFGRLIRTITDRGVVVVLDRRILEKGYGPKYFIKSLPDGMLFSDSIDDIAEFLDGPTSNTTGRKA